MSATPKIASACEIGHAHCLVCLKAPTSANESSLAFPTNLASHFCGPVGHTPTTRAVNLCSLPGRISTEWESPPVAKIVLFDEVFTAPSTVSPVLPVLRTMAVTVAVPG